MNSGRSRARLIAAVAAPLVMLSLVGGVAAAAQPTAPSAGSQAAAAADVGDEAIVTKYQQLVGEGPLSAITTLPDGGKYATFPKWGTTVVITWSQATGAHWISGAIANKWNVDGKRAAYGYLVADQSATTGGPRAGAAAAFTGGSVYYSDPTGARFLTGAVRSKFWALGNITGLAKFPTSDVTDTTTGDGSYADFEDSVRIYAKNGAEGHWISGALHQKFLGLGGLATVGYPHTDQTATTSSVGYSVEFHGGASVNKGIYWSPSTGAVYLDNEILAKYLEQGGPNGHFRFPVADANTIVAGGEVIGRGAAFTSSVVVYESPKTGTHWLSGALRGKHDALGGPAGPLGLPTSDQLPTSGPPGLYVLFGSDSVILWGPQTGALPVQGGFLNKLRNDGDVADYGLPQYDVLPLAGTNGFQQFQAATIFSINGNFWTVGWLTRLVWWDLGSTSAFGLPIGDEYFDTVEPNFLVQDFERGWIGCDLTPVNGQYQCYFDHSAAAKGKRAAGKPDVKSGQPFTVPATDLKQPRR